MTTILEAYFRQNYDAQASIRDLGMIYHAGPPAFVEPVNGRSWKVVFSLPDSMNLAPERLPNQSLINRVIQVVQKHDGVVKNTQEGIPVTGANNEKPAATNRLSEPLPDEVFDRYYAENPGEPDHREAKKEAGRNTEGNLLEHFRE